MEPLFTDVEGELSRALEEGALVLLYQPVVDLHDATIGGVEGLLRWRHERGVLPAASFLPDVRSPELLAAIGDFVLDEAAEQSATWRRRFESWLFPVSVNVGRADFGPGLVDRLRARRERFDLAPGALAFDISEPLLLSDVEGHRELVAALKDSGAQVVVDDFGTTHAPAAPAGDVTRTAEELMLSLVALEGFRIDVVKVDRELIVRCLTEPRDAQVIESIVKLAHLFGCRVLAEGVESGDEAERLRQGGFDLGQGYYFQRPHGPGHIDRLLLDLADARRAFATASHGTGAERSAGR